jgi:acyl-CoA thioesterase YciA
MELITRELCLRKDLGIHGNLFGGVMMSWLDKAGAIMATSLCESSSMVTGEMEGIKFLKKVRENTQVNVYGEAVSVGKTSIVIALEARKYNVHTGVEKTVCKTNAVFVRIDRQDGEKRPLGSGAKAKIEKLIKDRDEQKEN